MGGAVQPREKFTVGRGEEAFPGVDEAEWNDDFA
jgi:hypothetical protein